MILLPRDRTLPIAAPRPSIAWEEPNCLLCGRRHWSQLIEAPDPFAGAGGFWFAVVQCQECGLCFTNPRPDVNTIAQFYPPAYPPHQIQVRERASRWLPHLSAAWHLPGKAIRVLPWRGPGRLLDFGCGRGTFLQRMHDLGWQVIGIDRSTSAARRRQNMAPFRILAGTLPHPDLGLAAFDVVTMWHSLEHVHEPLAVLEEACRLLVPGGRLVVAVPNIDSLPFRWFMQDWIGLDLPRHLTHFAPPTLHRMLERAGFTVSSIRMVRHSHWLRASALLSCRDPSAPFWQRWLKFKTCSRLASWYCYVANQADCLVAVAEKVRN